MKLTLKIKLLPTAEQAELLLETIRETNTVCNAISDVAWSKRIFNNFKLHHEVYHVYKSTFKLSSQMLVRSVAKVADALGDTGRILVRESGTEPVVRVMVEAPDHDTCQKHVGEVVDVIYSRGYQV